MNLPLALILGCVVAGLLAGYGWALLEVLFGSWVGWVIVVAVVLAAVFLTPERAG